MVSSEPRVVRTDGASIVRFVHSTNCLSAQGRFCPSVATSTSSCARRRTSGPRDRTSRNYLQGNSVRCAMHVRVVVSKAVAPSWSLTDADHHRVIGEKLVLRRCMERVRSVQVSSKREWTLSERAVREVVSALPGPTRWLDGRVKETTCEAAWCQHSTPGSGSNVLTCTRRHLRVNNDSCR